MSNYQEARVWSDAFLPAMNQVAEDIIRNNNLIPISFEPSTLNEDRKGGIDMHLKPDLIKLSYRTRKAEAKPWYMKSFTIRTSSNGYPSELNKVIEGNYADYMLYALADEDVFGKLQAGVLVDMKQVGWQLKEWPDLIDRATKGNGFIEFPYHDFFPFPVVVGYVGVKEQEVEHANP